MATTLIRTVDMGIGIVPAATNLKRGLREGNTVCTAESTLELGGGVSALVGYTSKAVEVVMNFFSSPVAELLTAIAAITGITNVAKLGKESLSLSREDTFLSIFNRHAWKGPADQISEYHALQRVLESLEEIKNLSSVELERAVPVWLYQDLVAKGERDYLNTLFNQVAKGNRKAIAEATKLLDDMRSYGNKKRIVHILKITGAIVGLVLLIGFLPHVVFPLALTYVLMAISFTLATTSYMTNAGYVENREDYFSLKLCIPEFVRNLPTQMKEWTQPKRLPSSRQIFERVRIAKATLPRQVQIIREFSNERLQRRARLVGRGISLAVA